MAWRASPVRAQLLIWEKLWVCWQHKIQNRPKFYRMMVYFLNPQNSWQMVTTSWPTTNPSPMTTLSSLASSLAVASQDFAGHCSNSKWRKFWKMWMQEKILQQTFYHSLLRNSLRNADWPAVEKESVPFNCLKIRTNVDQRWKRIHHLWASGLELGFVQMRESLCPWPTSGGRLPFRLRYNSFH